MKTFWMMEAIWLYILLNKEADRALTHSTLNINSLVMFIYNYESMYNLKSVVQ